MGARLPPGRKLATQQATNSTRCLSLLGPDSRSRFGGILPYLPSLSARITLARPRLDSICLGASIVLLIRAPPEHCTSNACTDKRLGFSIVTQPLALECLARRSSPSRFIEWHSFRTSVRPLCSSSIIFARACTKWHATEQQMCAAGIASSSSYCWW